MFRELDLDYNIQIPHNISERRVKDLNDLQTDRDLFDV